MRTAARRTALLNVSVLSVCLIAASSLAAGEPAPPAKQAGVMVGVPPTAESQVTLGNYFVHPFNEWAFRNAGAPLNVLMLPRAGAIYPLVSAPDEKIGSFETADASGEVRTINQILEENHTDGYLVLKGNRILYERYFNGLERDYQHIWFSATKSLSSTAFGILVDQGKVDLDASPARYIPELKGSGFDRVTIQNLLNHSSAIDFRETYTDFESDFFRYYAPALNMVKFPGARDVEPGDTEIFGVHDFLVHFVRPNEDEMPGEVFDYNSSNTDVLGWLIARISGMPYAQFIRENIWAKLGTEHDAYLAVDRAYQGVATGGMNTTLRDAALFGNMILNRGAINGHRIVSANWVDATLDINESDKAKMRANPKYRDEVWAAYHNMWWVLDESHGEYAAVGIHGQVIYINRADNIVIVYFSSQPVASAAGNLHFRSKLKASRALARHLAGP